MGKINGENLTKFYPNNFLQSGYSRKSCKATYDVQVVPLNYSRTTILAGIGRSHEFFCIQLHGGHIHDFKFCKNNTEKN